MSPSVDHTPLIAREGWSRIALAVGIAVVIHWQAGVWWALPIWIVALLILQFFRDPPRQIPQGDGVVVSPAHGKVVSIQPDTDPITDRPAVRVSIFMNIFSVHSNRIPLSGVIKDKQHIRGRFLNAALDKASIENERCAVRIESPEGVSITSMQVAGWVARRILTYVQPGDRVMAGQRYGFIRFGSRVDVFLPPDAEVTAKLGRWVLSGSDMIARVQTEGS